MHRHALAKLKGICDDNDLLYYKMEESLKIHNVKIMASQRHDFSPQGFTASFLLAESHFYIHTYPEHQYVYCDCFTCGKSNPQAIIKTFAKLVNLSVENISMVDRSSPE